MLEPNETPGALLKATRELKQLSISEVASRLHLNTQWIEDIERNHYEYIPSLTYLKGYMRSYARLLELPEEKIIEMLGETKIPEEFQVASAFKDAQLDPVYMRAKPARQFWPVSMLLGGLVLIAFVAFLIAELKKTTPSSHVKNSVPTVSQIQDLQLQGQDDELAIDDHSVQRKREAS